MLPQADLRGPSKGCKRCARYNAAAWRERSLLRLLLYACRHVKQQAWRSMFLACMVCV